MTTVYNNPEALGLPGGFPMPKRADWRIGLIGFGGIAGAHVEAYQAAGWPIVAVADPSPHARERARKWLGDDVALYDDAPALLADPNVEVVTLLTLPTMREAIIAAAIERKLPALAEKPLAEAMPEAIRIAELSETSGVPVAVSQNYRYFPTPFYIREILRKGWIGEPFLASIEIFGTQDIDLKDHPYYPHCDNFLTVQWNTHLADLFRYWTGKDPLRVSTRIRRMKGQNFADGNLLLSTVDFGPELTAHILHHQMLRSALTGDPCRIDGTEGSLVFHLWGRKIRYSSPSRNEEWTLDLSEWPMLPTQCGTMGDLLLSLEEGRAPLISARQNLGTLGHVLADLESARQDGEWVAMES